MNLATGKIVEGAKVRCKRGSIDRDVGAGEVGYVTGFARFSSYHGREVCVQSAPSHVDSKWSGWFWLSDVELADEDYTPTAEEEVGQTRLSTFE